MRLEEAEDGGGVAEAGQLHVPRVPSLQRRRRVGGCTDLADLEAERSLEDLNCSGYSFWRSLALCSRPRSKTHLLLDLMLHG